MVANTKNEIKKENKKDGKKVRKQLYEASNAEKEKERERETREIYGAMETMRVLVVALAHRRARAGGSITSPMIYPTARVHCS